MEISQGIVKGLESTGVDTAFGGNGENIASLRGRLVLTLALSLDAPALGLLGAGRGEGWGSAIHCPQASGPRWGHRPKDIEPWPRWGRDWVALGPTKNGR
jgi:hypothetical protein